MTNLKSGDYFIIPNPVYDVVFKYLMEDPESAKIVLSTLIGYKILNLEFEPQSFTNKIENEETEKGLKLFHLDFSATIELPDGKREIIVIELQKSKIPSDIFRFKRYLAKNYLRKFSKQVWNEKDNIFETKEFNYRIFPIYIFNFWVENEVKDLAIKVSRERKGIFSDKKLEKECEFIDFIGFDYLIIQLPYISNVQESDFANDEYKTKLYQLLKLFDQENQLTDNRHRLLFIRKLFPGWIDRLILRLQSASSDFPDLEEQMLVEEEYVRYLREANNKVARYEAILKENLEKLSQKDAELEKSKEEITQKEVELEKKEVELEKKEVELEKKTQQLLDLAKMLKSYNVPVETIIEKTGLTKSEIENL